MRYIDIISNTNSTQNHKNSIKKWTHKFEDVMEVMEKRNETTDLEESHLLEVSRATSKKCLSVCELQRDHCSLVLTIPKGRHWQVHGHTHSGKTHLDIEEALFLAECGVLEIRVAGLPISIQQAYHTLLSCASGLSLALYQVYGTLKRCGYVVLRRHLIGLSDKPWPVCSLCRQQQGDFSEGKECWSAGIDLLQVYHSSRVLSKTNLPSPFASLILGSPTDAFPSPSALLKADQLPGDTLLAAVHQTNSIAFYKLTVTAIPTLN